MNVVEMHTAINTQLHQIDSAVLEDFLAGEIDIYLNRGQLAVLKQKVKGIAGIVPEEDIRTLISEEVLYPLLSRAGSMAGNPVSYLITVSGASGTLGIDIDQGAVVSYDQAYLTSPAVTATNWLTTHTTTLAALGTPIIATSAGSAMIRLTSTEYFAITDGGATTTFTQIKEAGSQFEYLCPYPDNYYEFVSGESGVTRTANPVITVKEYIPNQRILTDGQLKRYRITTYNKPYIREPRIYLREDFLHVLCDHETTLLDQRLIFVRIPEDIYLDEADASNNVNCELPDQVHDEIVEAALALMVRDLNLVAQAQ